ncbi:3'-5' exonuclease [Polaribacter gangjinensis]|uniref:Exonuclease domain-containing protein n=1 Tax=Polaribacter gangjinensis TaxID=574710 RepID=A0A2S7WAN7_9FLAO|nr:3'-5' exonuclease [Polaribacter gangjinensis]PQJ74704.1 hypothetical protein BTO13_05280 [Polaribacter gangjinensis]
MFFRKKYPPFWEEYLSHFKNDSKKTFSEIRFVILDTETTGLNIKHDKILSIGAIAVKNESINVADSFECFVKQAIFDKNTVEIHGIRKYDSQKIAEEKAIQDFLKFIKNAVLVGHHINFDIEMLNNSLSKMGVPKLKNILLDTGNLHKKTLLDTTDHHFSLDELIKMYKITPHDRHNALGDAMITAQLFLKITKKLSKNNTLSIAYLKRPAKHIGLI